MHTKWRLGVVKAAFWCLEQHVTRCVPCVSVCVEAKQTILSFTKNAEELLKRKKVNRELIFKYLAGEGVAMSPNTEKHQLVRRTLQHWSSGMVSLWSPSCLVTGSKTFYLKSLFLNLLLSKSQEVGWLLWDTLSEENLFRFDIAPGEVSTVSLMWTGPGLRRVIA